MIFINNSHYADNWMTINGFIEEFMTYSYIHTFMNITFSYLPMTNISFSIKSNPINISLEWRPQIDLFFKRNADNEEEMKLIEKAEKIDYQNYTGAEESDELFHYDYPNYINDKLITESLDSYYYFLTNSPIKTHYSLNYSASVHRLQEFIIDNDTGLINVSYDNGMFTLDYYENLTLAKMMYGIAYYLNKDFINNNTLIDNRGYICELKISESLQCGPLAGYGYYIDQYVILSMDFEVIYIVCYSGGYVS